MNILATEEGRYTFKNQVIDGIFTPTYKWFSLQDNILDGSFHPLDSLGANQIGWWGTELSGVGGVISTSPTLTIEDTRSVHNLDIIGDDKLNEYPVDFVVTLYNGASIVFSESVVGNTLVHWNKIFSTVYDVTKIEVVVTKVNKVGRTVKLVEGINSYSFSREDSLIVDFTVVRAFYWPLLVKLLEESYIEVSLDTIDTLPLQISPDKAVTNYLTDTTTLLTQIVENKDTTGYIYSNTNLTIIDTVDRAITNYLNSSTNLLAKLIEEELMRNVYTIMDQMERLVYCKAEILYTDPILDLNLQVSASEEAYRSTTSQLADGVLPPQHKWFVLDNNILDGTFHPIDATEQMSIGWRSAALSDALGEFSSPPVLILQFDPRTVYYLQVYGDSVINFFPVDFTLRFYDSVDTLLHTETITGNTEVAWTKTIDAVYSVAKLTLEIQKVNQPLTAARVVEFYSLVQETYDEERLQTVDILEETGYVSGGLPLGNVSANEVDITLNNFDHYFDKNNPLSPVAGLLKRNRRVKVWFGVEVIPDVIEWYLNGIFWTISWNVPTNMNTVSLVARDRLELMRQTDFATSQLYENYTLYQLFELILTDYGLTSSDYYIDSVLSTIIIPYAWFTIMSHREALQYLAGCSLIRVFCTKLGVVNVLYNPQGTENIMVTWDDDVNLFESSYPLAWEAITNYVEVKAKPLTVDVEQNIYTDTDTFTIAAGETVTNTYNFSKVPAKDIVAPVITADVDIVVDSYNAFAWGIEITFKNNGVVTESVYGVSVAGKPLTGLGTTLAIAKDDRSIQEEGKLKTSVEHDFIQNVTYAQQVAASILTVYNNTEYDVNLNSRGNIALRLGDRIHVNENARSPEGDYVTIRQQTRWDGALSAIIDGKKIIE